LTPGSREEHVEDVLVSDILDHTRARAIQEELALRISWESVELMQGRILASLDGFSLRFIRERRFERMGETRTPWRFGR